MSEPERLHVPFPEIYQVPKVCKCGARWTGNSFSPAPADGSPIHYPCTDCITRAEQERAQTPAPVTGPLELSRPRRVDIDD